MPLGTVASAFSVITNGGTFSLAASGGATPVVIDASSVSGSATLFYQVDRTNGIVTITPQDITSTNGLNAISSGVVLNAPVKVYGVPQANGSIKAYVVFYFTGTSPTM